MAISYLDAIRQGFPTSMVSCSGDPFKYDNIVWEGGDAIPSQEDVDLWIVENPGWNPTLELSKYEFRQLFTMAERVAIDKAPINPAIPVQYQDILRTVLKDLELSGVVHLDNPATANGVKQLEQLHLIGPGRAVQILANQPPSGV